MQSHQKRKWTSAAARRLLELTGQPTTIEEAVQVAAKNILIGIPCPPTDLEAIMPRLNINGFCEEELPISGELRRDGEGFVIAYSSYLSRERRRFTIAHEMGHALFEATGPNCPYYGKELERLCDMIATELLMPREVFLTCLSDDLTISSVKNLSKVFKTSLSATAIRCSELRQVSTFEVENQGVSWGSGIVRKGQLSKVSYQLQSVIEQGLAVEAGEAILLLAHDSWKGEWKLEWERLGNSNRALFLLQPMRPVVKKRTLVVWGGSYENSRPYKPE